MSIYDWISRNYIEFFGAVTGIIYVFLEIKQTIWLWPVGILTSAVYIWVFFTSKIYADMSLQVYYLVISILGWYWWTRGSVRRAQGAEQGAGRGECEKGRKGERGIASNPGNTEDWNCSDYCFCFAILSNVDCPNKIDGFAGTCKRCIYNIIIDYCNLDAGEEDL